MIIMNLAKYIDHTLLKPEATREQIIKLCDDAIKHDFFSVCVNPSFVKTAHDHLQACSVKVCTVVGFPLGTATTAAKVYETEEAVAAGADEIDMVINVGAIKSKDNQYIEKEIAAVVEAAKGRAVKVIIETGLLSKEEKVLACKLAKRAGANFVKTSTGFGPGGATVDDVKLMQETVGPGLGVKASGGVRSLKAALDMIDAGATRIGTSSGIELLGIEKGEGQN